MGKILEKLTSDLVSEKESIKSLYEPERAGYQHSRGRLTAGERI
jgi:hypothetical protein